MTAPTDKTQPPPGWQWATWRKAPELNADGTQRVRLSGTMNTRALAEAWADYEAEPCPYEGVVPRITAPDESPAAEPPTDDVRTLLRVTVRQLEAAEERVVALREQLATVTRERDGLACVGADYARMEAENTRLRAALSDARRDIAGKLGSAFKRGTSRYLRACAMWGADEAAILYPDDAALTPKDPDHGH